MTAKIFLVTFLTVTGFAALALEGRKDELEVVPIVDLTVTWADGTRSRV